MLLEIVLFFILLFILAYYFITKDFQYFASQPVPVSTPSFPFGSSNIKKMMTGQVAFTDIASDVLKNFPNEKIVGYFMFQSPRYIINDLELAKRILIKDFEYFTDRPAFNDADPINNQFMTNLTGAEWKRMRVLMSGVFTSGRLRLMLPYIAESGDNLAKYVDKISQEGKTIDMKDTFGLLTLDSIATAGFGIENNSFDDLNNVFRMKALALVGAKGYAKQGIVAVMLKTLIINACPKLGIDILKFKVMDQDAMGFFVDVIRKTYKQRKTTNQKRNDLIDVLLEELNKSNKGEKADTTETNKDKDIDEFEANAAMDTSEVKGMSFEDEEIVLVANALIFFFAGFDTTSLGLGMACHKLCIYEDLQEAVHDEIMDVFGKDGKVTFDKLAELKYMDRFINESLRSTTIVPQLERLCTKNYKLPGTDIVIPKGRVVNVYTQGFAESEEFFVNAKQFDPENFNPENNPNKFGFSSFGHGPRNCIGMRYAMLVIKVGLVNLLRNHKIKRGVGMKDSLQLTMEMNHFEGGVPATIHRRED